MSCFIPSGYLCENHIVFGDLGRGAVVARGYAAEFPDLSASDDQAFIDLESDMRLMIGSLREGDRLQVQFYTSSDFAGQLGRFENETREKSRIEISSQVRNELVQRFRARMETQTLIQSMVRIYLSSKVERLSTEVGERKVRGFDEVFKVFARSFEQRAAFFDLLLRSYGGGVRPLSDRDHYNELLGFWSPGQARGWKPDFEHIDLLRTIDDLCRFSDLAPRHAPEHGFYLDGQVVGLMVFKTMPRSTWAHTMAPFFALTIPNLRVVVNIEPLGIEGEIRQEEERFSKLMSNIDPQSLSLQSEVGLTQHRERMRRLLSNQVIPCKAQIIVIAHDNTRDGVDIKLEAIRAAIGKTGSEPYRPMIPSAVVSFFNAATPAFGPWIDYRDFYHKIDDLNLANMLPVGSTPEADLKTADWICDGDLNNLIGGTMFRGSTPDHMMVAATTGAGKSVLLQTIALQTAPLFRFMVVIDDGLSWLTTCHKLDSSCRPIVVRANGNQTFNIFDTCGNPVSPRHISNATALCHLLVGRHEDSDLDKIRAAILSETINEVYAVAYRKWRNANPEKHYELCHETARLLAFQRRHGIESFADAFTEARANPALFAGYEVSEADAMALDRDPLTNHVVQSLAFAGWTPRMFPTLSDLQDELHTAALQKGTHQTIAAMLGTLLRPWLRDGRYGQIVDGASNIDLGSAEISEIAPLKVVHFELGSLGESESEIRAVVGFLVTNQVRNHIEGMNRGIRKLVLLEELTGLLKISNAQQMVRDFYERSRKFSTQVISIFQQYSTLLEADPKVAKALVGNSASLLLLRNHNRKDLETLSHYLPRPLPEVIMDQISGFPRPAELPRDKAYAGFVYAQIGGETPKYTVGRNFISDEVERITSSSGDVFEHKRKELRNQQQATMEERKPCKSTM